MIEYLTSSAVTGCPAIGLLGFSGVFAAHFAPGLILTT